MNPDDSYHDDSRVVTLPGGVAVGEQRYQEAVLRPLTGREEELLAATAPDVPAARRVTALLARCLRRLGPDEAGPELLRALTVGDREALLLHLRRATLGERIDCLLTCPDEACAERIDVDLRVADLLVAPYADASAWHEETWPAAGGDVRVRFRLPTGGDQEAVADLAAADPEAAAAELLERCVDRIEDAAGNEVDGLDEETVAALAGRMADLDPQAEIRLRFACPACQAPVEVLFDTARFFFAEIAAAAPRLYEEVHSLAWYYHWGMGEILDLTARQRRRYLDLIAASLSRAAERRIA